MNDPYLSLPLNSCFDNDPPGDDPPDTKTFTQGELNNFLAKDRHKHQERIDALQSQINELTQSASLAEEQRQELEELRSKNMTAEERSQHDREKLKQDYQRKIEEATKRAEELEKKHRTALVTRAIKDAAVAGAAYSPDQVFALLSGHATVTDDDQVVIEWNGESLPPDDVIKRMKETPDLHGNLFKANVVGGLGSNSSTGVTPGKDGKVDLAALGRLDPVAYRKARKEHPELFN